MNPNRMYPIVRMVFLSLMFMAVVPVVGLAAIFNVNSFGDGVAANPANGICETVAGNGICTLRAAIQVANASVGTADTINLPSGTYSLTIAGRNEDLAATGDLDITGILAANALTINGTGLTAGSTIIDGGGIDRVFDIIGIAPVTISNLTIRNGNSGGAVGGGIRTGGKGISLTLNNVIITGNTTGVANIEGDAINIGNGGATVTMNNVAVTNNNPLGLVGGNIISVGAGGSSLTILNGTISGNKDTAIGNSGIVTLTNVTISGNTAVNAAAIDNKAASTVTLQNCTINGNTATAVGNVGGIRNAGTVSAGNTVITNNTPLNCNAAITSRGNNLASDAVCIANNPANGDVNNATPLLGPLADNGGSVLTHALLAGSPAIDTGTATGCPATDARGIGRPVDGNIPLDGVATCDKGAFEFRPQKITVTLPPPFDFGTVTSATTSDHTITLANAGDGALIIGTIAAADPLVAPFSIPVDNCSGLTLARAASCTVTARFAPTAAVTSPDTFNIPSNDPAAATVTFALTGTGTALPVPIIAVTDSVAPANDLSVSFGSILVGATKDETITISNNGTANLVIGTIATANPLAAPFSITVDGCSGKTIAPAANCTMTVHFAPTLNSALSDTFDIPTNEADAPTVTVSLSGAGISVTGTVTTVAGNNPPSIPVLVSPANGQTGLTTSVLLSWNKSVDPDGDAVTYQVINCTNQDFSGCTAVDVPASAASPLQKAGLGGLGAGVILIGFVAGSGSKRSRKVMLAITVLLLMGAHFLASCSSGGGNSTPAPGSTAGQVNFTVSGLTPATTYFWKIIAADGKGGLSSSETRNYKTQ